MSANVNRIAFTGGMPWWVGMPQHDRGQWQKLPGYANAADMMKAAQMDFRIGRSTLYTFASKADKDANRLTQVPDRFAIVRSDTLRPLPGVAVGPGYECISFPDMFSVCDEVTSKPGFAHYETAGTLYEGRTGWALIRLDEDLYIGGDTIRTYLLGTTSHDGSASLRLKVCNTRVVCCNTFGSAMSEATPHIAIRHTRNYQQRIADAQKILGLVPKARAGFVDMANAMLAKPITQATYVKLAEILFPAPEDTADRPVTKRMLDNVNAKRQTLANAAFAPDLENIRFTAWGALNAVADAEQHLLNGIKGDDEAKVARLFERSFDRDALARLALSFLVEA